MWLLCRILNKNGYNQYEISNYSKDNYYSIHNINYWNNGSYYGFGLGSVSYINNYRITNTKNLSKYLNNIYIDNEVYEDKYSRISNTLILGLRKTKGINIIEFNNKFNTNMCQATTKSSINFMICFFMNTKCCFCHFKYWN